MVAPFGPGAGVATNILKAQNPADQPGETGAMVRLAVSDYLLVGVDAEFRQFLANLFQVTQAQFLVYARRACVL